MKQISIIDLRINLGRFLSECGRVMQLPEPAIGELIREGFGVDEVTQESLGERMKLTVSAKGIVRLGPIDATLPDGEVMKFQNVIIQGIRIEAILLPELVDSKFSYFVVEK